MAKEYIEREAALEAVSFYDEDKIRAIPAADVRPVVRCKDCKYSANARVNEKGFLICTASGMEITDHDYCSYGARMDGDGE